MSEMEDIYRRVPALACKGLCHDSCGVIVMQGVEVEAIEAVLGAAIPQKPFPHADEENLMEKLTCPLLVDQRCSVHEVRPLICRLWGVIIDKPGWACPHGCRPKFYITERQANRFIKQAISADPRQFITHTVQ